MFGIFNATKLISTMVVSIGTGSIIGQIVKPLLENMKTYEKVCAVVASAAIEGVVADAACTHLNAQIDDIAQKLEPKKITAPEVKEET